MTKRPTISLSVPADLKYSALVRDALKDALSTTKIPHSWIYKLVVVLDELFMNAVKYGSHSSDRVEVSLHITTRTISFEVRDSGNAHQQELSANDLHSIMSKNESSEDLTRQSGRGLAVFMKKWVDKFSIKDNPDGGLSVYVEKRMSSCIEDKIDEKLVKVIKNGRRTSYHVAFDEQLLSDEEYISKLTKTSLNHKGQSFVFDFRLLKFLSYEHFSRILALETRILDAGGKVDIINVSLQEKALFDTLKETLLAMPS